MTVVVGTAGHIDHGKTALLTALTGIDADRLPEERRRGMTIDLGYAHMTLRPGVELDFVDVPGHDRLVGNMLVGAGEIDAVLLVVAADEGVSAQTREHFALLDAFGVANGVVALTKLDLLAPDDPRRVTRKAEIRALLEGTTLAGSPIVGVSARTGEGLDELRERITQEFERTLADVELLVPFSEGALLSEIHDLAGEMEREDTPEGVRVTARIPTVVAERYGRYARNGH